MTVGADPIGYQAVAPQEAELGAHAKRGLADIGGHLKLVERAVPQRYDDLTLYLQGRFAGRHERTGDSTPAISSER